MERKRKAIDDDLKVEEQNEILGKCEACHKPWDRYRGKRRCPTCGVPLLVCKDCNNKVKKNDKSVRCDLCVEEGKLVKIHKLSFQKQCLAVFTNIFGTYQIKS